MKDLINSSTIITDSSCFILLDKIDCLFILERLYGKVLTTPEIAAEYGKYLPLWTEVKAVKNRDTLYDYAELVDIGEASAMALAHEVESPLLILDDLKARKLASQLNLQFTGTIGVIILARTKGIIPELRAVFEKINSTDFRLPADFLKTLVDKYDSQQSLK